MTLAAFAAPDIERLTARLAEAIDLLRPFAALASVCDHFNHPDAKAMCGWTLNGVRWNGPSCGDCRKAREFLKDMDSATLATRPNEMQRPSSECSKTSLADSSDVLTRNQS